MQHGKGVAMRSRRFVLALGSSVLLAERRAVFAQEPVALRVGMARSDAASAALYAVGAGLFARAGLSVTLEAMTSGSATVAAVVGGALQLGETSLAGLVTAHARGLPLQLVAAERYYLSTAPNELLVVRRDGPLRSARDLNGKTIASSSVGDLLSLATLAWIDANGGDSKTVKAIELPPSATQAAIESGRIDAACLYEPFLSEGVAAGAFRTIGKPFDAIGSRFLATGVVATPTYVAANRDVVRRYAEVLRQANMYANAHRDETAPLVASWTNLDVNAIRHSSRATFAESLNAADVQPMIDAMVRFRLVERSFDAHELINS
jgi:NitT/TauT family transport system substrate-binding protein